MDQGKNLITRTLIVTIMVFVLAVSAMAKAKANDGLCGVSKQELMECKPAVATGAAPPPPTAACCAAVAHADIPCFCAFKNNTFLEPLFGINATRAVELPSKCDPKLTGC